MIIKLIFDNNTTYIDSNSGCTLSSGLGTWSAGSFNSDNNKWHNYTCTYDSANQSLTAYLDGNKFNTVYGVVSGQPTSLTSASLGGSSGLFGFIDSIQVFSGSLLASDVQKQYVDGLATHQFAQR